MDYKFKKKKVFRCKTIGIDRTFRFYIFTHVKKRVKFKILLLNEYIYIYIYTHILYIYIYLYVCAMRKSRRYARSLVERAYN